MRIILRANGKYEIQIEYGNIQNGKYFNNPFDIQFDSLEEARAFRDVKKLEWEPYRIVEIFDDETIKV